MNTNEENYEDKNINIENYEDKNINIENYEDKNINIEKYKLYFEHLSKNNNFIQKKNTN